MNRLLPILSLVGRGAAALLLIAGLAAVAVVAAARLGVGPAVSVLQATTGSAQPPAAEAHQEPVAGPGITYSTDERVVNLVDRGAMRYLKVRVVLEFAVDGNGKGASPDGEAYKKKQEELRRELLGRAAVIDDRINMILSSKTSAELITQEGKNQLKQEIKDRLNEVVGERQLMNVYFTQFIIQ